MKVSFCYDFVKSFAAFGSRSDRLSPEAADRCTVLRWKPMSIKKMFLGLGLTALLLGIALFVIGKTLSGQSSALATEGIEATATVLKKVETQSVSGSSGNHESVYRVELSIPVSQGGLVGTTVLKQEWEALEEGGAVQVVYLGSNPQTFLIGNRKDAYALLGRSHLAEMLGPGLILFGSLLLILRLKIGEK